MALGMTRNALFSSLVLSGLLFLGGCADEAVKKADAVKKDPPKIEPVSGNKAFFLMYGAARGWALDAQPYSLISLELDGVPKVPGKAGAWQATFASPGSRKAKAYTYCVIEGPGNLHKGVFAGLEESWSGPRGSNELFIVQALKVDSDKALETAIQKGKNAAEYVKKNPDKRIFYLLEKNKRHPNLTWRVLWGDSVSTSNYSVFVDASTGQYLETMR